MNRHLLLSFFFISSAFCIVKIQSSGFDTSFANHINSKSKIYTDTTIILFGDSSYRLRLHMFDTFNIYNEETYNSVLTFIKYEKNQIKNLFSDSMFCMYPDIAFQDFNNDKKKDVMVFYYSGARANPTYHLYLSDPKNRKLIRINGFEKLSNPYLDTTNNIIMSIALSGSNYYSFYRISSKNKLLNLGHSFDENPNDSTQYDNAIRQILKENH